MKKVLKTVAMILIVVIIANSFTGCIIIGKGSYDYAGRLKQLAIGIDIGLLVFFSIMIIWAILDIKEHAFNSPDKAGIQDPVLSDQIDRSIKTFNGTLKALPKTQVDTLNQKVLAVPETEKILLMESFNGISQTRMISLLDEVNALSETELNNKIEYLNSLSEIQFNSLLKSVENNRVYAAVQ